MREQYSDFPEFDAQAVGQVLAAQPRGMRDVAHGEGQAFTVAEGKAELEVYPAVGMARATTAHARIEVYRVPRYSVDPDVGRVVFEHGADDDRTRLLVQRNGRVTFHPILRALATPTTAETTDGSGKDTLSSRSAPEATTAGSTTPEDGEPDPVQLTGRLGRDPWFNTEGDTPVARFPLAVNDDSGKTTWHRVVVSGEVAQQVQDGAKTGQFKKGRLVNITGHEIIHTEPTERGGTRTSREFHASAVTRLTTTRTRPAP